MKLFTPPGAPSWFDSFRKRVQDGLGEPWASPLRLQSIATADLPTAADYPAGLVYDSTTSEVKRSDGSVWLAVKGASDVAGPASATDNAVARFDGTTGELIQNSSFLISDAGIPALTSQTGVAGAIGAAIADYFSAAVSLDAGSTYEIECLAYFLKTTAGTLTWTWTFSSAPTAAGSLLTYTPVTGFTTTTITGAPVNAEAHVQAQATMAHAATASLTSAVYHVHRFRVFVRTNAATTIQLRATESAGTITPQTGSYMRATKII